MRRIPILTVAILLLGVGLSARGQRPGGPASPPQGNKVRKPQMSEFIWTDDVELDNTVIFRHVVKSPPDGKMRTDFSNLNNVVPAAPPKPGSGSRPPKR